MGLSDILLLGPAISIENVTAMLTAIDGALPDSDGLKWFNRLYLRVTMAVQGRATELHDPEFVQRLDVAFANLYFDAAAAGEDARRAPHAWRPVLQARNDSGITRLQFALAGMNAHINRDLPVGIVETYRDMGGSPIVNDARHEDFERVNDILEAVEAEVKAEFLTGALGDLDVLAGRLDDVIVMWKVRSARQAAWTHAQVLWTLRDTTALRAAFLSSLDSFTGFAGRGLLAHVA